MSEIQKIKKAMKAAAIPLNDQNAFWAFYYGREKVLMTPAVCQWLIDALDDSRSRGASVPSDIQELCARALSYLEKE